MKKAFVLAFLLCATFLKAQIHEIELPPLKVDPFDLKFQVVDVVDSRQDTNLIGSYLKGAFNRQTNVKLKVGNTHELRELLVMDYKNMGNNVLPVVCRIDSLVVGEGVYDLSEFGYCFVSVSFLHPSDASAAPIYRTSAFISDTLSDVFPGFPRRITRAFDVVLIDFNRNGFSLDDSKNNGGETNGEVYVADEKEQIRLEEERIAALADSVRDYRNNNFGGRNIISVGYQIGGWTMVGAAYEVRLTDLLGFHFGAGYAGYTGGLNFHFSPSKNSFYISPNYKDGGFGELGSICLELGKRIAFEKNSYDGWGLQVQLGVQLVQRVSNDFKKVQQRLTGSSFEKGDVALSMGIGFSF